MLLIVFHAAASIGLAHLQRHVLPNVTSSSCLMFYFIAIIDTTFETSRLCPEQPEVSEQSAHPLDVYLFIARLVCQIMRDTCFSSALVDFCATCALF